MKCLKQRKKNHKYKDNECDTIKKNIENGLSFRQVAAMHHLPLASLSYHQETRDENKNRLMFKKKAKSVGQMKSKDCSSLRTS